MPASQITTVLIAPSRLTQDRAAFDATMDSFLTKLAGTWTSEANALSTDVNAKASAAAASQTAAATSEANATAAAQSASNAATINGTSTTTITPAVTSAQTLVYVETGRAIFTGMRLRASSTAAPSTNWLAGTVTSWNSGTKTVTLSVDRIGSIPASASSWNVTLEGSPGADGSNASVLSPSRTVTSNASITAADNGYEIDVTATGVTLTADSAAAMGDGFSTIINAVGFPVTVVGSFNDTRTTKVIPLGCAALLTSNGTTHRLQFLPQIPHAFGTPGAGTVIVANSNYSAALCMAAMTSTRGFVVSINSANSQLWVYLVDDTGAVLASAALAALAGALSAASIVAVDASRCLLVWVDSVTNGMRTALVSFAGTSISFSTIAIVDSAASIGRPVLTMITATKAVLSWQVSAATSTSACVLTVPATGVASAPTVGTTLASVFTFSSGILHRIAALNSTQVIIVAIKDSAANGVVACVLAESGGTLTKAAAETPITDIPGAGNAHPVDVVALSTGRALVAWSASNNGGTISALGSRACVVEYSANNINAGPLVPVSEALNTDVGYPYPMFMQRLVRISADTYARVVVQPASTQRTISASCLTVRDYGVELDAGAMIVGRNGNGFRGMDAAVFGNKLLVLYADGNNSGYPTLKAVPLNSVA